MHARTENGPHACWPLIEEIIGDTIRYSDLGNSAAEDAWSRLKNCEGASRENWNLRRIEILLTALRQKAQPELRARLTKETLRKLWEERTGKKPRVTVVEMYRAHVEQRLADTKDRQDNFAVRNDLLAYSAFLESEKLFGDAAVILRELADLCDAVFRDPVEAARARSRMIFALVQDGQYLHAERSARHAVRRLNRSVAKQSALRTRLELALNCALVALHRHRFEFAVSIIDKRCRQFLNELRRADRSDQYEGCEATMEIRRGAAQISLGQLDDAESSLIAGICRRNKIGALVGLAHGLHNLALLHQKRGDAHFSRQELATAQKEYERAYWLIIPCIEAFTRQREYRDAVKAHQNCSSICDKLARLFSGRNAREEVERLRSLVWEGKGLFPNAEHNIIQIVQTRYKTLQLPAPQSSFNTAVGHHNGHAQEIARTHNHHDLLPSESSPRKPKRTVRK